jgi:hypothetical protein
MPGKKIPLGRVVNPDPHGSALICVVGSRRAKLPTNIEKLKNINFLKCWMFFFVG